jgi:cytochrome P450
MQSILYHIMKNPPIHAKLVSEIDNAAASGLLSNPIKYSEAIKLPYLVAVCKEGMRVFPSVGMTLPRHVPKGGSLIAGKFFAEGVSLRVPIFASPHMSLI